jgi:hypothetical protein
MNGGNPMDKLSARYLAKHGMQRGAYDGSRSRRFVLFVTDNATTWRHEFDTKRERDAYALAQLEKIEEKIK